MKKFLFVLIYLMCFIDLFAVQNKRVSGIIFLDIDSTTSKEEIIDLMSSVSFKNVIIEKNKLEYIDVILNETKYNKVIYQYNGINQVTKMPVLTEVSLFVDDEKSEKKIYKQINKLEYNSHDRGYYTDFGLIRMKKTPNFVEYSINY